MTTTPLSFRRRTLLATAIAALCLGGAACANADPVDLTVIDRDTGQPLRVWRHDGRLFVAGEPGERYGLRVVNHTNHRVMVVMSVDGVNIVTGETASLDQDGYVFDAGQSYEVTGWRKSTTEVAAFSFAPLPQSYAARTGRPADVGVIGMAVFDERVVPPEAYAAPKAQSRMRESPNWTSPDVSAFSSSSRAGNGAARQDVAPPVPAPAPPPPPPPSISPPASAADMAAPEPSQTVVEAERRDERLGTAHGPRETSVVEMVDFVRATPYPQFTRQIEYDTHDNLVASGVIPGPRDGGHRPRPFPLSPDESGFVPDPPG
jgi:hypothetical protein